MLHFICKFRFLSPLPASLKDNTQTREESAAYFIIQVIFPSCPPVTPFESSRLEPTLRMFPGPLWLPCQRAGRTQGLHRAFQCNDPITVCQQIHWDNSECNTLQRLNPKD